MLCPNCNYFQQKSEKCAKCGIAISEFMNTMNKKFIELLDDAMSKAKRIDHQIAEQIIEYLTKYRQEAEKSELPDVDFQWLRRWWFGEYDIEQGETGRAFSNAMDRWEGYYHLLTEKQNMLYAEIPILQPPPAITVKTSKEVGTKRIPQTITVREKHKQGFSFKSFGFYLIFAIMSLGSISIGTGLIWLDLTASREEHERNKWIGSEGVLHEVGIEYRSAGRSSRYVMTVRYTFSNGQREFEGTWIEGRHWSHYLEDVKNLVVPYAPDAANLKEHEDFHFFGGSKTWQLPLFSDKTTVPVRYDPSDPKRSVMEIKSPLPDNTAPQYFRYVMSILLIVIGLGLITILLSQLMRKYTKKCD